MTTFASLVVPFLLQLAVTLAVIFGTQGGGSFVGLWAMLLGGLGIPLTAILNWALIRTYPNQPPLRHFTRSFIIGLILPALQVGLLIATKVFLL